MSTQVGEGRQLELNALQASKCHLTPVHFGYIGSVLWIQKWGFFIQVIILNLLFPVFTHLQTALTEPKLKLTIFILQQRGLKSLVIVLCSAEQHLQHQS